MTPLSYCKERFKWGCGRYEDEYTWKKRKRLIDGIENDTRIIEVIEQEVQAL